jgi:hypothetical protein
MRGTDLNSRRQADDEVVFTTPSSRGDVNPDGTRNIAAATSKVCRSEALVNILIADDEPKNRQSLSRSSTILVIGWFGPRWLRRHCLRHSETNLLCSFSTSGRPE